MKRCGRGREGRKLSLETSRSFFLLVPSRATSSPPRTGILSLSLSPFPSLLPSLPPRCFILLLCSAASFISICPALFLPLSLALSLAPSASALPLDPLARSLFLDSPGSIVFACVRGQGARYFRPSPTRNAVPGGVFRTLPWTTAATAAARSGVTSVRLHRTRKRRNRESSGIISAGDAGERERARVSLSPFLSTRQPSRAREKNRQRGGERKIRDRGRFPRTRSRASKRECDFCADPRRDRRETREDTRHLAILASLYRNVGCFAPLLPPTSHFRDGRR